MNKKPLSMETEHGFVLLEERLAELIDVCQQNINDRETLQAQCNSVLAERQALIDQNEQSRARIDAMVLRLKGIEQAS